MTYMPDTALRDFVKTPVILDAILAGVDQQRAEQAADGPDGWSVLEVVGHMNEYEEIFFNRAKLMMETERPNFPPYDQNALALDHNYQGQQLAEQLASYHNRRDAFVAFVKALPADAWQRTGIHPSYGEMNVIELVIKTTLHDVNHIEQILKALDG
jgi:hypothetical protein